LRTVQVASGVRESDSTEFRLQPSVWLASDQNDKIHLRHELDTTLNRVLITVLTKTKEDIEARKRPKPSTREAQHEL
jgi:hypothetical protein